MVFMSSRMAVLAAVLFSLALPARAADDPAVAARALAASARVYYMEGKLDRALELFQKAYSLYPDQAFRVNIARILDKKGETAGAQAEYEAILNDKPDEDTRAKASGWLAQLLQRLKGRLLFDVLPEDAEIEIDGVKVLVPDGKTIEIKQGRHDVMVRAEGHVGEALEIDVQPGGSVTLKVRLAVKSGSSVASGKQPAASGSKGGKPDAPAKSPLSAGSSAAAGQGSSQQGQAHNSFAPAGSSRGTEPAPSPVVGKTPWYKKWWIWTIVGGVVVAGVGTAVGLTVGKQAPERHLTGLITW